jgi:hypothetical protein
MHKLIELMQVPVHLEWVVACVFHFSSPLHDISLIIKQLLEFQEIESSEDERKNDMSCNMPTGSKSAQHLHIPPSHFVDDENK